MLEDQVANLLQRYLGNYVKGLSKEALKISVWQGDVELTNMQLKPEALNPLKLPVKVKAGFLGSVKLKVFRFGTKEGKPANKLTKKHTYVLEPVFGNAKYSKLRQNEFADTGQPLHKAAVNLDDVTICLPKDGYRDVLKLADNFAAFNQRLKYAHYRPHVSDQMKKASGKLSWEQVLKYARLRKRYISLYAPLLRSDPNRAVVEDNKDIEELDRELDIELILQWSHHDEYSWSSVVDGSEEPEESASSKVCPEISVSALTESEKLLYCSQISSTSSSVSHKLWFCMSIQATEIAKDIHSDSIQDWNLVVKSPLSISNFLPLAAEYSVLEMQENGGFVACSRGVFSPGKTVNVFTADIRKPLYFSLLPQRGWLPIHEAVLLSHPQEVSAKTINLRSSISGRIVQIILEQNPVEERPLHAKIIRLYAPYWFSIARCPPLTFRLVDIEGKKETRKMGGLFQSKKNSEVVLEEITEEEIYEGHTIASALKFKML
ncbi:hypothetical protein ACLB2K_052558 [Fragaria x ananassa]